MNTIATVNCVGIDVSKGKSTIAILRPLGEVVKTPFEVSHTSSELKELCHLLQELEGEIKIVMEYTGKYYQPIARYLCESGFFVSVIHAKLIHDFANNSIRKIKTDKADAVKIASYGLANWELLRPYSQEEEMRFILKTLNRQYNKYMKQYVAARNNYIALLDQTFPDMKNLFKSARRPNGHMKWIDASMRFWHAECVSCHTLEFFTKLYNKWCLENGYKCSTAKAKTIYMLAAECVPSLPKNEYTQAVMQQAVSELIRISETIATTQKEMNTVASMLPEYPIVLSMDGVGTTLGPQIMAEIGDVRRFSSKEKLVAFAGVDAPPYQSGKFASNNRHISKRGSAELRKSVFQVVSCRAQVNKETDPVCQYLAKKKAEGKHYYTCMIACCNKFLRIYYAQVKEYLDSVA